MYTGSLYIFVHVVHVTSPLSVLGVHCTPSKYAFMHGNGKFNQQGCSYISKLMSSILHGQDPLCDRFWKAFVIEPNHPSLKSRLVPFRNVILSHNPELRKGRQNKNSFRFFFLEL